MERNIGKKSILLTEEIINKDDYYTSNDIINKGYTKWFVKKIIEYIPCYKYHQRLYFPKDDFHKLQKWEKELGDVSDFLNMFNISSTHLYSVLQKYNITYLTANYQPFEYKTKYYLKDKELIKSALLKGAPEDILDEKKYIKLTDAAPLLNQSIIKEKQLLAFDFKTVYCRNMYLKKSEVEYYARLRKTTIEILFLNKELCKLLDINYNEAQARINKIIKAKNMPIITKHPFPKQLPLISKKDAEFIKNEYLILNQLESLESGIQKYKLLSERIDIPDKIKNTINMYDDFIITRLKVIKNEYGIKQHVKVFIQIKEMLIKILTIEIYKYSKKTLEKIIENIALNESYSKLTRVEFVAFYNYLIDNKILVDYSRYKLNKNSFTEQTEILAYTQSQFIELFRFLHTELENPYYLDKIIKNRGSAQVWLYMYLHYIIIWRRSDIFKIPFPNLENIGFSGEGFLKYMEEGNVFTTEMGIIIVEDVKKKINTYGLIATKNNNNLVMEIGRFTLKNLGFLLAICEAHRQIAVKQYPKKKIAKQLITDGCIARKVYYDELFGDKLKKMIGTDVFSNRRANKSYNNYIQNYSEEHGDSCGAKIFAIMRSHSLNENEFSETSQIYETRKIDNTIKDAVTKLFNRGSFAFLKLQTLKILDNNFKEIDLNEKNKDSILNDLSLTPYEIEYTIKNILNETEQISNLITKMIINPGSINKIIVELANGNTYGKHAHSRCLLKAILNSIDVDAEVEYHMFQLEPGNNCIMKNFDGCIGCPFFIEEMYFLYELNDLLFDSIIKLNNANTLYDKYMYTQLIFKSYIPILQEAQIVLGKNIVNTFVNVTKIKEQIHNLRNNNLILLNYTE